VNRKAETVSKNRETGTTDFRSATFGFEHAAITIGKADHPLAAIYDESGTVFKLNAISGWDHPTGVIAPTGHWGPIQPCTRRGSL
jgi:hypothetical protein